MTFWDWADKHPVTLVLCVLIIGMSIPSFTWKKTVNDCQAKRSGGQDPP